MHHSNWSMQFSICFPDSCSEMTIGMYTFGSCLMDDTENIALPQPTYEDERDEIYPNEHQAAWFRLIDALEAELEGAGYSIGSTDDDDFYLVTDYMPSNGISCSVLKPELLTLELIDRCQRLTRSEVEWNLWVRLGFDFVDKRHKGHSENILVRPDRVIHDYDAARLRSEFGSEWSLWVPANES